VRALVDDLVRASLGDTCQAVGDHQGARRARQPALTILEELRHPDADKVRTTLATSR
jgi:hypothetical protein